MGKRRRRASSSPSSTSTTSSSCSGILQHSGAQALFAVTIAALSNREFEKPTSEGFIIIQKTLDHLLLSLLSKYPNSVLHNQQTLPVPLISLFPVLINSKCSEIKCSCLEIVGAASLFSLEMNEQIACDEEILKGLIAGVGSSRRDVMIAACNAVLDLLTTSVGRCRLLEFSAIDKLIFWFLQVSKLSAPSVSLVMEEMGSKTCFRLGFMEDEYLILVLQITIILINDCTIEQLENIPRKLCKSLRTYLATLWAEVRKHILQNAFQEYDSQRSFYLSNFRTNNLAESLFRLSMEATFTMPAKFQEIESSIFHSGQISFESFILTHFEKSPLLITKPSNALFHNDIFCSFPQFQTVPSFLTLLLQNLASALPISSDELDIISFLDDVREHIGCPLIYQQDIRVVKTLDSKEEKHFFSGPHFLYERDILRCEEAYKDGYTCALRGMEFHFDNIAAISEGLTFLFGQPSTGVNMYLTPPNSQGLALHRDDHCVFVCQIEGVKRWKVFPNPCPCLPRLYENVNNVLDLGGENELKDGCKEFLLREGDILYIPRGFPHKACTITDDIELNGNVNFSLHLTLAIEIEPPFEWEGFLHIALHHWGQNHTLNDTTIHLMHIAIKQMGATNPTFRKACLIGSPSFPLTHQQSTFTQLLNQININTKFKNIFSIIKSSIEKQEDIYESLTWLCHLDLKLTSIRMEDLFSIIVDQKGKIEEAFMEVKSRFCGEVVFEDVVCCYNIVLEKYRRTRKQYMNGMLSLNRS